jgi:hypothetical protein
MCRPAFDPGALLGIAHREQTPSPQARLDLQPANAPSAFCAEADRNQLARPAHPFKHVKHRFGDNGGKRTDQFIKPEFPDIVGRSTARIAGARPEFGELQLRDPDRILIAHAHGHQPRDFKEHRVVDIPPSDETPQPRHIKPRVTGALVIYQPVDAFADNRRGALGQTVGEEWRRVVVLADEIGEQIAQRG